MRLVVTRDRLRIARPRLLPRCNLRLPTLVTLRSREPLRVIGSLTLRCYLIDLLRRARVDHLHVTLIVSFPRPLIYPVANRAVPRCSDLYVARYVLRLVVDC